MKEKILWHLYVLRTADGGLYTGIATDVERRLRQHRDSTLRGAKSLRGKGPLQVVFERTIGDRVLAQRIESRIKKLSKQRKEGLVEANPKLQELIHLLAIDRETTGPAP